MSGPSIASLRQPCPCGTGRSYDTCCGLLHRGEREAATAEELMRARYAAYAVGAADFVFRTWHPRTRPAEVTAHAELTWTALEVLAAEGGGDADHDGVVEFVARARVEPAGRPYALHERSRFVRRAGRWFYLDGDVS